MTNPMTDSAIQDAIYEILNHRDWNDKLSGLRPTDTITVDISHDDFIDLYLQRQGDFMTIFRNAVFRILQQRFVGIDIPTAFSDLKIKLTVAVSSTLNFLVLLVVKA